MKAIRYISAILFCLVCTLVPTASRAQIGYQVSLLNTATGEPRAGVTVNAVVTITDSSDKVVYTGTQQATTNDFGVLSLAVGDDATFKNADWSKLPFFISVSVDGTLVGKSQILSVPVAEYAKKTGELTKEMLVGTWVSSYKHNEKIDDHYYRYDSEGNSIEVKYTYMLYDNPKNKIQFFEDGTFKFDGYWKGWTVGHRDSSGNIDDNSEFNFAKGEESYMIIGEYLINGNDVRMILSPSSYDVDSGMDEFLSMFTETSTNLFVFSVDMSYIISKEVLYCESSGIFSLKDYNCSRSSIPASYTKQ